MTGMSVLGAIVWCDKRGDADFVTNSGPQCSLPGGKGVQRAAVDPVF
jgi:hypothetical protein